MNPIVFLDRDGVINKEVGYLSDPDQFKLLSGVGEALRKLKDSGFMLVIISNQSGIARGYFTLQDLHAITERMNHLLAEHGVILDGIQYCPHHPDENCECRKPKTGMIKQACEDIGCEAEPCYFIGDKTVDILTGKNAGCKTILVKTGYAGEDGTVDVTPDIIAEDLADAVGRILKESY